MTAPPTTCFYRGKKFEEFSKEELVKIAEEGWKLYHESLQSSIRAIQLMADLHKATRR
jgi:predicted RNase H-like HicB family nuclease